MLGRSVGNYRLISKIGQGGMGVVYLAQHKTIGRRAAVKVLVPELSSNQDLVSRFFNEARAATAIRNPSIVEVFDFGFLDDRSAYIVMEYLDGESLAARIRKARPKVLATLVVVRAIARALHAAHDLGIVHRDLKPDNVFLVPDAELPSGERIKLLDFGIAKLTTIMGQTGHTRTGTVMGTPTYMAPEQCRGAGSVDHRADLYALGCIAYEMLCGQPPFVAEGAGEMIARHLYFEPAPPRTLRASIRPEVEELVLRLLQKDPGDRPSTATEVVHVIDRLVATAPTVAPRAEPADPSVAVRRRRSEPLRVPAIVDAQRDDIANPPAAASRPRAEPAVPLVASRRERDELLDPTLPAGRPRSQPESPVAAGPPHREPVQPMVAAGRSGGEPAGPTVPSGRRRSELASPPMDPDRLNDEPVALVGASGRARSAPADPVIASGRARSEPAAQMAQASSRRASSQPGAAVVASQRRSQPLTSLTAADLPRGEDPDRPVVPSRLTTNTTLSGAAISDVSTWAPTVLRSRFARSRITSGVGGAIVVVLAAVTWSHLAPQDRGSEQVASVGPAAPPVPSPSAGMGTPSGAAGSANPDHVTPPPGLAPSQPNGTSPQPPSVTAPPIPESPSAHGGLPPASTPSPPIPGSPLAPATPKPDPGADPTAPPVTPGASPQAQPSTTDRQTDGVMPPDGSHKDDKPPSVSKGHKTPRSSGKPKVPPGPPPPPKPDADVCAPTAFAVVSDATSPGASTVQAALAQLKRCSSSMDAETYERIQRQLLDKLNEQP